MFDYRVLIRGFVDKSVISRVSLSKYRLILFSQRHTFQGKRCNSGFFSIFHLYLSIVPQQRHFLITWNLFDIFAFLIFEDYLLNLKISIIISAHYYAQKTFLYLFLQQFSLLILLFVVFQFIIVIKLLLLSLI